MDHKFDASQAAWMDTHNVYPYIRLMFWNIFQVENGKIGLLVWPFWRISTGNTDTANSPIHEDDRKSKRERATFSKNLVPKAQSANDDFT